MKMLIKYIAIWALSFSSAIAANWTGSAVEPENMKKIDGKAFYVITTADELAWFAAQVNSGKSVNGVLSANITLGTTYAWTPIGKDSTKMFQNVFDGGNYTITTPYTTTGNFAGLFGVIGANGVVKNVKVANPSITHTRNGGAIAGFNNGTIDNVSVMGGSVTTTSNKAFSGGIVGRNNGTISNSSNGSAVSNKNTNQNNTDTTYAKSYAGGIAGFNLKNGVLRKTKNSGSVYAYIWANQAYAGGATSYNMGSIIDFSNSGSVRDSSHSFLDHQGAGFDAKLKIYAGGVAGINDGSIEISLNKGLVHYGTESHNLESYTGGTVGLNNGTINKSENLGQVGFNYDYSPSDEKKMYGYMGGIVAWNTGKLLNSKNSGKIAFFTPSAKKHSSYAGGVVGVNTGSSAQISNCFSTSASIDAYTTKGGIAGQNLNSAKIFNSYYDQTLLSSISAPVGTQSASLTYSGGKSTADMKKDQFAWILNTTNGTAANSGAWSRTDGYPIFATEDNKAIYKVVFNDDGVTSNRYTNYKGQVSFPEDPEAPEGLVFSGWYNADDIKVKPTTVFSADQTVNAVYVDASDVFWTINFYNAAPADTVLESKSYQHGSIVAYGGVAPTLAPTAKYTYTFKGWDVEPTNAVEDFDYHAVYDSTVRSYAITFINTDSSKIESASFEYGKMPNCTKTPTREATVEWKYSHKGWKPALDFVTEDASYLAIYDSVKVKYKVTFMNGTSVIDTQSVAYGEAAVAPTNVNREGYKFVGWNTSFAKVTEALTVKALFEELIIRTVNVVNGDGDKIVDAAVEDGGMYTLPEAPKKEGYTFDAYYDGDKKLGVAGDEISVTANITITAKYIENPKSSSSQQEIASSSSTPRNDKSSSSSFAKSSSSSKVKSSSSEKIEAIIATAIPQFSVMVNGRSLQISAARIGATYALFDMQGKVLLQGRVQSANFEIPVACSGNYLIRVGNNVQRIAVK
ncbi:InlB B-repeat-containing protein [Fibrobacter sp.]|uniref:InlB B-repeat-containing protein n=1 Tax=Fibrobacter sp. TaxID=35828 RepID=UPI002637B808|nr:InlB B-repeat-containing protein [Fibrobacter sp.]MDD5943573.1 InlB B-repeat-containing protein [Fibrobacter sp.]